MKRAGWLAMWVILVVAVALTILLEAFPVGSRPNPGMSLPMKAPLIYGENVELNSREMLIFGEGEVVKRLYHVAGNPIMVNVVDGKQNRHAVHDPIFCFRGAGWSIISESVMLSGKGEIRIMALSKNDEMTRVAYWFSNGERHYISPIEFWMRSFLHRATFGYWGDESVLVVIQLLSEGQKSLPQTLRYFPQLLNL